MTDSGALAELGRQAHAFARCYLALTEALMSQGVPEEIARQEARASAAMAAVFGPRPGSGEACPYCGRSG